MECQFCKKILKNVSSLDFHQKTTKYCIKIQNGNIDDKSMDGKFNCTYCLKKFTTKQHLIIHYTICKEKYKKDALSNLDSKIKELEDENKDLENKVSLYQEKLNEEIEKCKLKDKVIDLKLDNVKKDNILSLNSIPIISRKEDGYINLTALCKAGKKEFNEWKRNKKTQEFLKVLNSFPRILGNEFIKYNTGSNHERSTWGHPQVAVNIAQWISPEFDVRVSKWIYELALTGKVELENEKTTLELDNIYEEKRLSLDIQPYLAKDIVYFFEFIPNEKDLVESELLKDKNIHFFEFGVTSNIQQRQISYGSGYRLDKGFIYKTGYLASLGESYVKKIVTDMNLKLGYKNKIECMKCTYDELERIYELMDKHSSFVKDDSIYETKNYDLDLQKMELELKYKLENTRLEINAKQEQENYKLEIQARQENSKVQDIIKLFKENILTFEQFQKCLSLF